MSIVRVVEQHVVINVPSIAEPLDERMAVVGIFLLQLVATESLWQDHIGAQRSCLQAVTSKHRDEVRTRHKLRFAPT